MNRRTEKAKGHVYPPPTADAALDDELRFHIEERASELVAQGMSEDDAREEVLRRLGDLEELRETCLALDRQSKTRREARYMLGSIVDDFRLASKALVRNWAFSLLVLSTLALGIAASVTVWSVVDRVLLQPLPFEDPSRLVSLYETDRVTGTEGEAASVPDFLDFQDQSQQFEAMAGYDVTRANFLGSVEGETGAVSTEAVAEPRRVQVANVTANMLKLLGRSPILGRDFDQADDVEGAPQVALLEESFWRDVFRGDAGVLGRSVRLDDELLTIVGVVPAGLEVPSAEVQIWRPSRLSPETSPRWSHFLSVVGRLKAGSSFDLANQEIGAIAARLEAEYRENADRGAYLVPLVEDLRGEVRPALLLLLCAVAVVMVIVCANVANLLLLRGTRRRAEVAMSSALGASAARTLRRFLFESWILTGGAALVGCLVAVGASTWLLSLAPTSVRALAPSGWALLDPRVMLFSVLLALMVGTFCGLVPALQARSLDVNGALRAARGGIATGNLWVRRSLVVSQFAFAVPLVCGAGLLVASLNELGRVEKGFATENILRVSYHLPESRYPRDFAVYPNWTEVTQFNESMLEHARSLPGVTSASLAINHPLEAGFTNSFVIVGREDEGADLGELKTRIVSPSYFETNGVELLDGRLFDSRERPESGAVMLVNQKTVDRYFEGQPVLGERIAFWGIEREIVGVVANEKIHGLEREAPEAMYVPLPQAPQRSSITLMVHAEGDPLALTPEIRAQARRLDPQVALYDISTMEQTLSDSLSRHRFTSLVLLLFAGVAGVLAALGVYSVLSYLTALRRREVGLRMAIGSSRIAVVRSVLAEGLLLAGVGVLLGIVASVGLSRFLGALLFGVKATDPVTYLATAVGLFLVCAVACSLPAIRAATVSPAEVLGSE